MTRIGSLTITAAAVLGLCGLAASAAEPRLGHIARYEIRDPQRDLDLRIAMRDGAMTVILNGENVPADRFRWAEGEDGDDVLLLLDESGNVVRRVPLPGVPAAAPGRFAVVAPVAPAGREPRWVGPIGQAAGEPGAVAMVGGAPPRAMLGVFLGEPSEDVRAVLGLEGDTVVFIDGVMDDMPAAKAGLKKFDIIVEADGRKDLDPEAFREIMAGKKPGDPLEIVVLRRGERKVFRVELGEALTAPAAPAAPLAPPALRGEGVLPFDPAGEVDPEALGPLTQRLAPRVRVFGLDAARAGQIGRELRDKAMAEIASALSELSVAVPDSVEERIREALKYLEEGVREAMAPGTTPGVDGWPGLRLDGQDQIWLAPGASNLDELRARAAEQAARMLQQRDELMAKGRAMVPDADAIEARVKELEARLESRVAEMEERLMRALERRAEEREEN